MMNKRNKNPVSHGADRLKLMQNATRLYEEFTGDGGEVIAKIPRIVVPKSLAVIGEIDAIEYRTRRNGEKELYRHSFTSSARPLFCVSPDGKQIFIVGGDFTFTKRGIVDNS